MPWDVCCGFDETPFWGAGDFFFAEVQEMTCIKKVASARRTMLLAAGEEEEMQDLDVMSIKVFPQLKGLSLPLLASKAGSQSWLSSAIPLAVLFLGSLVPSGLIVTASPGT